MTWKEYVYWFIKTYSGQCKFYPSLLPFFWCPAIVFMLCGCATRKSTESVIDYQRMETLQERMDSLFHSTSVWQQSIFEKQTSLVDSFKQKEVHNTSHTVFLGANGDTLKEKIIIREIINSEHTSESKETEYYKEMLERTDSMLRVSNEKIEKLDSAYHADKKDTVVEKQPSLFDKLKYVFGGVVLGMIGLFAFVTAFMKKK